MTKITMTDQWIDGTITPTQPGKYLVAVGMLNKAGNFDRRYSDFFTVFAFWTNDEAWVVLSGFYSHFSVAFWMPIPDTPCKPAEYPYGATP